MNDHTRLLSMTLAGLLHDIGKFFERSDGPDYAKLSPDTLRLKEDLSYSHAWYTSQFFEDFEDALPFDLKASLSDDPLDSIKGLASYHHKPKTPLQKMITLADWCSAGMDRAQIEDAYARGGKRKVRLEPIFASVDLGNKVPEQKRWGYPLEEFSPEVIFPRSEFSEEEELTPKYRRLWDRFTAEVKNIPTRDGEWYIHHLLDLLENYTWCVPSTAQAGQRYDISLFDHLKTTAAIAAALWMYHFQKNKLKADPTTDPEVHEEKFLLVGGDLSGIQKYLFNLAATGVKGSAKLLRGRSCYIGMMAQAASRYILRELGLPSVNTVMSAGGRFILLVHNTPEADKKLSELEAKIETWCVEKFFGYLNLVLDFSITLSPADLKDNRGSEFTEKLKDLSDALERKKRRKFASRLQSGSVWNAGAFMVVPCEKFVRGACHYDEQSPADTFERFDDEEEESPVYSLHLKQRQIGEWLLKKKAIHWFDGEPEGFRDCVSFFNGQVSACFAEDPDSPLADECYRTEQLREYNPDKEFRQIVESGIRRKDDSAIGADYLGVLKADVDNLGLIFSEGFRRYGKAASEEENLLSISRYATLSRMLDAFFGSYLTHLRAKHYPNIYSVYAGGDDLFLIGYWDEIIRFSKRLRDDFRKFTAENPDIHFSAGIALVKHRYPVRRAADLAEELLDEAKKEEGKNRLSLFNTIIRWDEFDGLEEYMVFLDQKVNDKDSNINSSFLNRLLRYHHMFMKRKTKPLEGYRYHALMEYDIGRNIIRRKNEKIVNEDEVKNLHRLCALEKRDERLMETLKIPLFWAMYRNRKTTIKEKEEV